MLSLNAVDMFDSSGITIFFISSTNVNVLETQSPHICATNVSKIEIKSTDISQTAIVAKPGEGEMLNAPGIACIHHLTLSCNRHYRFEMTWIFKIDT